MEKRKNSTPETTFIVLLTIALLVTGFFAILNHYTPAEPQFYTGTVLYPYLRYGALVGIMSFFVVFGFCLRLTIDAPSERFKQLIVVIVSCFSLLVASSGHLFLAPTVTHLDTLNENEHIYYLTKITHAPQSGDYFEWVLLYECDARGWFCHLENEIYSIRYEEQYNPPHYQTNFSEANQMPLIIVKSDNQAPNVYLLSNLLSAQ